MHVTHPAESLMPGGVGFPYLSHLWQCLLTKTNTPSSTGVISSRLHAGSTQSETVFVQALSSAQVLFIPRKVFTRRMGLLLNQIHTFRGLMPFPSAGQCSSVVHLGTLIIKILHSSVTVHHGSKPYNILVSDTVQYGAVATCFVPGHTIGSRGKALIYQNGTPSHNE